MAYKNAHERIVNTQGMAVAGAASEGEKGTFGVVVGQRSGPTNITAPTAVHVHLVSIEGVEQMETWPITGKAQYVALSSLHSWTYMCLPPSSRTIYDDFVDLGQSVSLLKPRLSNEVKERLKNTKPAGPRMLNRLEEGFSLSRYRTQTGEMTGCLVHGPLVPCDVKLPDWWKAISMTGQDLQFLDGELGLMDISYSAAWQLGRSMAMADAAFTTSLFRIRQDTLGSGHAKAAETFMKSAAGYKSRTDMVKSLEDVVDRLGSLDEPNRVNATAMSKRWCRSTGPATDFDLSYHGEIVDSLIDGALQERATWVTGAYEAGSLTWASDPPKPYNEYNTPNSPDWVVVQRWVLDRMLLDGIPSHYLITDASHLPLESIRFFQIDDAWSDSFLDGALSLGNLVDQHEDKIRNFIKERINDYLKASLPGIDAHPPMPRYGCYVRSGLVKKFPDLIVTVEPADDATPAILVRHSVLDNGIMLCLFSAAPNKSTFTGLRFTKPPHQQTFIAGRDLTDTNLTMEYRRAYTEKDRVRDDKDHRTLVSEPRWDRTSPDEKRGTGFLWEVSNSFDASDASPIALRVVHVENLAVDYLRQLKDKMPAGYFKDEFASSALLGYQLSEPSYALHIEFKEDAPNLLNAGPEDEPHLPCCRLARGHDRLSRRFHPQ
ncbi:hypothetical protein BGZ61DRAFT_533740 [Ilyonectria robusta]|uniref:uncharacterized protein n=1 Tax=Ilyonectria robusta TaxID=1079257 RepID=UPI001E8D4C51|nr:uncharacterized protein BGZ61DRAFT_533740 [Ilyonectria robusta]KAH8686175.1 hypothetical protein BGZ61DRAFT_533740 [Ilyonectria robusta]